jgi:hypothetical protein
MSFVSGKKKKDDAKKKRVQILLFLEFRYFDLLAKGSDNWHKVEIPGSPMYQH